MDTLKAVELLSMMRIRVRVATLCDASDHRYQRQVVKPLKLVVKHRWYATVV